MSDTASVDGSEDSYEVIDYSENPLFLILSAIFEDSHGRSVCDHLARLTKAVEKNTAAIERYHAAKIKIQKLDQRKRGE